MVSDMSIPVGTAWATSEELTLDVQTMDRDPGMGMFQSSLLPPTSLPLPFLQARREGAFLAATSKSGLGSIIQGNRICCSYCTSLERERRRVGLRKNRTEAGERGEELGLQF